MSQPTSRRLNTLLVILLMMAAFVVGYGVNGNHSMGVRPVWASLNSTSIRATLDDTITLKPVELFHEAFNRVQMEYVEPITKPEELTYGAIRGMLAELKDPYTRYMDPKEYKDFTSDNAGHFAGIGATLNMTEIDAVSHTEGQGTVAPVKCPNCGAEISEAKQYRVAIVETLPNSPAKSANLQSGDMILKVDDKPTDGLLVSDVADMIRGPEGSKVTLTLARKNEAKPIVVSITRAQIEVPAVESKMLEGKIGYVRLFSFNEKTVDETRAALMDMKKDGAKGLVLDLRNNPGGLLTEAIKTASMFLPDENKVIVSTQGRYGDKESLRRVDRQLWDQPMIVLVNKGSASASEILSGALRDYKRAKLVGETTFGKALVQSVIRMSDGSAMAITTAHYYTPSGFDLNKKGIDPDVKVELSKDVKILNEKDNQAKAALDLLNEQMAKK